MKSEPKSKLWVASGFGCSLAVAVAALASSGVDKNGIGSALAATARVAFLFFWPAYTGSALVSLFGATLQPVKRRGPQLGLAFASALLVHLALVAGLCFIGAPPAASVFVIFGIAAVCVYLLALCSWDIIRQHVPKAVWFLLNKVGMNYIAFAFALDFVQHPIQYDVEYVVKYVPFAALAVLGPLIRLAALALGIIRAFGKRASGSPEGCPPGRRGHLQAPPETIHNVFR